tara:strand:- start:1351 stop:2802 length:1452 start_codon:yes stop_codon:yes gene_type:complete
MAIVVQQQPGNFEPIGRELIMVATSTNVSNDKFNFVFDVKDGAGNLIARVLIAPNASNAGVFNYRELLQDQLSSELLTNNGGTNGFVGFTPYQPNPTDFYQYYNGKSIVAYEIEIGESYAASPADSPIVYPNLANKVGLIFLGSLRPYFGFVNNGGVDYNMTSGLSRMLSDRTSLNPDHSVFAPYCDEPPSASGTFGVSVERVNSKSWRSLELPSSALLSGNAWNQITYQIKKKDGTIITHTFAVPQASGTLTPGDHFCRIPAGPANLSMVDNHIPVTDQPNTIGEDMEWYRFYASSSISPGIRSWYYYFVWDANSCGGINRSKFNQATIMWENTRGGFDYFDFNMRRTITDTMKRKNYRKVLGNYYQTDGSGSGLTGAFDYEAYDHALQPSQVYTTRSWRLSTDYLTELDYMSIQSLFTSQKVWILTYLDTGVNGGSITNLGRKAIPVNITDTNFGLIQMAGKKPATLTINLAQSQNRYYPR